MQVLAESGLVLIDSGLPCDTFNIICRARLTADQAPQRIREAIAFFHSVGRPFSWWVGPAERLVLGNTLLVSRAAPNHRLQPTPRARFYVKESSAL